MQNDIDKSEVTDEEIDTLFIDTVACRLCVRVFGALGLKQLFLTGRSEADARRRLIAGKELAQHIRSLDATRRCALARTANGWRQEYIEVYDRFFPSE